MGFKTLLLLAAPLALAHPGHKEEVYHHPLERRDLNHCEKSFSEPEFIERTVEIHGREFARLRRELGLETGAPKLRPRDYISVSKIDHKSSKAVSKTMDLSTLFSDAGACILMPAVDQGPLYVKGEQVRKDITEGEAGIKMTLAIQVVDYKTCKTVPNAYVDIWSSNSTGMYVGVQGYPGMGDPNDASILKGTALRGIQATDDHGIASFDSLLPGHYAGRATHIHAIVYLGATKQPNNTITGGRAAHVGQLYFDQPFLTAVNQLTPYNSNTMAITQNTADFLFMQGANGDDPIVRYALVGNTLSDGVFAWIRFGINQNANKAVSPAAFMGPNGGVMNPNGPVAQMQKGGFGFGGGSGFGMPAGTRAAAGGSTTGAREPATEEARSEEDVE
ncbi:aromatic compound dioxygenase [Diplogelasinospora grovesii]|uniref:Aromatic compound dioxygenase n=1 Tax=Diplogelasinospora grovesii TaxID=303347 RepID=A0AAN6S1B4_9PEZI|nr:aromatic compound dioxygenase [Diplogelasinospora grovesii]